MLQPPSSGSINRIESAAEFRGIVTAKLAIIEENQKKLMELLIVVSEMHDELCDIKEGNKRMNWITLVMAGLIGAVGGLISGKGLLAMWGFIQTMIK